MVVFDTHDRIIFNATSTDLYGKSFYFKFVVRASGSKSDLGFAYYCSVQVARSESEVVALKMDPKFRSSLPVFEFFAVENLPADKAVEMWQQDQRLGLLEQGFVYYQLRFLVDVHMERVQRDFESMFNYWVRKNDFSKRPEHIQLHTLEGLQFNQTTNLVIFRVKFHDPTDYGLLIRKNDSLVVDRRFDYDYVSNFINNDTRFLESYQMQNTSSVRLEMVFDWSLDYMQQLKNASTIGCWVSIAAVLLLWLVLVLRDVSGVGMSIFVDYAQLVSFMPLLCARYSPQLYEIFKAFLWSNLVLNRSSLYFDATESYYSQHQGFYGVSDS